MRTPHKAHVYGTYPTDDAVCIEIHADNRFGNLTSVTWLDYEEARRLYRDLVRALGVLDHPHSDTMP